MYIHLSAKLSSPAPCIFSYLTDTNKLIRWQSLLVSSEQLSEGPIKVGSRFYNVLKHPGFIAFGIMRLEIMGEVLIYEPNERLKIKGRSKIGDLSIDYKLSQADDELTRLEQITDFKLRGIRMIPLSGLIQTFLTEQFLTDMKHLKKLVENETT